MSTPFSCYSGKSIDRSETKSKNGTRDKCKKLTKITHNATCRVFKQASEIPLAKPTSVVLTHILCYMFTLDVFESVVVRRQKAKAQLSLSIL